MRAVVNNLVQKDSYYYELWSFIITSSVAYVIQGLLCNSKSRGLGDAKSPRSMDWKCRADQDPGIVIPLRYMTDHRKQVFCYEFSVRVSSSKTAVT